MGVFTHISEEELSFFLNDYNLKNVESFIGINEGIQNTNYKTRIDSKDFILTIYENIDENNDLDFFLSLMNYLSSQGIKCPTPIKNSSLNYIGKIQDIENPVINYNIFNNLAYGQWTLKEIETGMAWEYISKKIS